MPKIDAVDIFYLRGPEILDISDNSQDATLIRISAGGEVGWGESDASPLPSIGALIEGSGEASHSPQPTSPPAEIRISVASWLLSEISRTSGPRR